MGIGLAAVLAPSKPVLAFEGSKSAALPVSLNVYVGESCGFEECIFVKSCFFGTTVFSSRFLHVSLVKLTLVVISDT